MQPIMTTSAGETRALGMRLAKQLMAGDAIMLYGDMGAGKSELTRGIARGLGIEGAIPSPTFTIMQAYDSGRIPLYHFDWYRLASAEELYEMGMDEYLTGDGVAVVEWPSQAPQAVPEKYLRLTLTPTGSQGRQIALETVGGFRSLDEAALRGDNA